MTHLYTILTGGLVLPARDRPAVSAIAWAGDTLIGLGSDDEMRRLSRGDSTFVALDGASVVPLALDSVDFARPGDATLEVGGRANLAILERDPREEGFVPGRANPVLAVIRDGVVVSGGLPGAVAGPGVDEDHEQVHARPDASDESAVIGE